LTAATVRTERAVTRKPILVSALLTPNDDAYLALS